MKMPCPRWALTCWLLVGLIGCSRQETEEPIAAEMPGNVPRLRPLDFSPFEAALARFSKERLHQITTLIRDSTIPELQKAMQSRQVTSEELTLVFLHRIKRYDGRFRSYLELNPRCLEEARASDELRAQRKNTGPLHGIPINLKDNIGTRSPMHTTAGAEILLNHSPSQDAALVTQLREAGALILGKASLSELAGSLTTEPPGYNAVSGMGVNPYGETFPVSGSSSGSAVSTNAELTSVSVGTETSGSLISPASMNGVVAMKPSLGLVSGDGVVPLIRFQDSAGPVARSVTDAAVLLSVLAGKGQDYLAELNSNALEGVRVGVLFSALLNPDPSTTPGFWLVQIDHGLRHAKAVAQEIHDDFSDKPNLLPVIFLGLSFDTLGYLHDAGAPVRTLAELKAYNEAAPKTRIPRGQNMIDLAAQILPSIAKVSGQEEGSIGKLYEQTALEARAAAAALLAKTFADHQVEVLVSLGNAHSEIYATAGYPAITVPLGLNADGAPNGITFIGKPNQDAKLLAYAYAFEQATRFRRTPESTLK
jgi:amidase